MSDKNNDEDRIRNQKQIDEETRNVNLSDDDNDDDFPERPTGELRPNDKSPKKG
jgi:hypothetical protein